MTNTNKTTRTWQVLKVDGSYYLQGLVGRAAPGKMLLARHDAGDVDDPTDIELMHCSLYDLYQTCDQLSDGDLVETPHGKFRCAGVHVTPCWDETKAEAKARRARLRRLARKI